MTLRGATGEIRWVYLPAVTFGPWRIESEQDITLVGTVASVDDYRITQGPLVAVVQLGRSQVRYPVLDLQIDGQRVTARLGPRT